MGCELIQENQEELTFDQWVEFVPKKDYPYIIDRKYTLIREFIEWNKYHKYETIHLEWILDHVEDQIQEMVDDGSYEGTDDIENFRNEWQSELRRANFGSCRMDW